MLPSERDYNQLELRQYRPQEVRPYNLIASSMRVQIPKFTETQLTVRDKLYTVPDHPVYEMCSTAVEESTDVFMGLLLETPDMVQVIQTPEETELHAAEYTREIIAAIEALHSDSPDNDAPITIATMATGGFAPAKVVMDSLQNHPLADRVQFVAIDHTPNEDLTEVMRSAKGTIVIDDGLTTAISLINYAVVPYLLEEGEHEPVLAMLDRMRSIYTESGTCNAPELQQEYEEMMRLCEAKGIVIAPLYSRNTVLPEAYQRVAQGKETGWAYAQRIIANQQAIVPVPEGVECVGASLAELPCRDLGIKLDTLLQQGLDPRIAEYLQEEGLGHIEMRHLARLQGLYMMSPQAEEVAQQVLAAKMNELFLG